MTTPVSKMLEKGKASATPEAYYDSIADLYDAGKKKNLYYFNNLVKLYTSFIQAGSSVLDIGCGTGDLTVKLGARDALGIDLSEGMIQTALKKYGMNKGVRFEHMNIFDSNEPFKFDYVTMADVLEHVVDVPSFMKQVSKRTPKGTRVIISVINPIWEPVLMVAERLRLKIPEGPHERLTIKRTEEIYREAGFKIENTGYRFLVPKKLPGSDWVNAHFYNGPLARLGLVIFWVLTK